MYFTVSGVAFICSHTPASTLSDCTEVSNKNFFGFSNLSQERKKCSFPLFSHSLRNHKQSMLPMLEFVWSLLWECTLPFGIGLIPSFVCFYDKFPFFLHIRGPSLSLHKKLHQSFLARCHSDF